MDTTIFLGSLFVAVVAPVIALRYIRPILFKVLRSLCDGDGGAEFWIRCAYVLAICGTLLLVLLFGEFNPHAAPLVTLRRVLLLVLSGVFISIAFISKNVWKGVRQVLDGAVRTPATPKVPS